MKYYSDERTSTPINQTRTAKHHDFGLLAAGYEGVVKMLLEREDANPDHSDDDG